MDNRLKATLQKQRYHVVGDHAGVKVCHWTKESLLRDRVCYKGEFYGVESHRCLQMAPVVDQCNLACTYCWREPHMDSLEPSKDDPFEMLHEAVRGQRRLLTGFKGDPRVNKEKWEEAQTPTNVAISLNGEPTLYPRLGEYIEFCHDHGMTTMLVTNGTLPKVLATLDPLPTQLYVSVDAPNEEVWNKLCKPKFGGGQWRRFMETIDLLPSLDTRIVCRHTLVKGENMTQIEEYAELDRRADPDWVEAKGYVFVGHSRQVMNLDNMPRHEDVMEFARSLAPLIDRQILDEVRASRVALIGREKVPLPVPKTKTEFPKDLGRAPTIQKLKLV